MIEESAYTVAWSSLLDGPVTSLAVDGRDVFVASGHEVVHLSEDGVVKWSHRLRTSVYQVKVAGDTVAALSGPDMWLLDRKDGEPRLDSRRVPGGFRCVSARPGGGWLAADRGDHLHLFAEHGRGIRRLRAGGVRSIAGWFDREHLLSHAVDGRLAVVLVEGEGQRRFIEDRVWAWVSPMQSNSVLLATPDGRLYVGRPNPWGWDHLDHARVPDMLDPTSAAPVHDGWIAIDVSGELRKVPAEDDGAPLLEASVDWVESNGSDGLLVADRRGLIRWLNASDAEMQRSDELRLRARQTREAMGWEQRAQVFERAKDLEDAGAYSQAIQLYRSLGRDEDVHRLLAIQESDR
ncbi:MAG: hypothetical protein CMB77_08010 [Euryarchaeota archaeon]|nr:hypothetical protein [Euryarchaeota archaeon]